MNYSLKPLLHFTGRVGANAAGMVRAAVHSVRFWVIAIFTVIIAIAAYYVIADRSAPLTTDAYLQAYVVQVAPQVGGQVVHVYVHEGDRVTRGSLLFELDARPFEHKVALLEAKLVEARQQVKRLDAEVKGAHAEHKRREAEAEYAKAVFGQEESIFKGDSTTKRKYLDAIQKHKASAAVVAQSEQNVRQATDALEAMVGKEHSLVAQVQAQLAEAKLNLEYTKVFAPCDGIITDLQLREGAYAHVGQAVLACIDTGDWVMVANFRENNLVRMQPGQPALIALHGEPGRLLAATVQSVGAGVSQGQGVPSGLLPQVKNSASWVPLAQRFQVRLTLDDPENVNLRVGMTGSVSVYTEPTEERGVVPRVTEGLHRILSWLYYL
jgi:multidrug resistance efflux pump